MDVLLELFFDTTDDYAIIELDADGIIRRWNRGARRLFGYTAEEVEGASSNIIFVAPDQHANIPEFELETAAERGRAEDERWHVRKDGSRFWASGLMIGVRDDRGLRGFVKIIRDFTERRRLEEAVQQTQKLESVGVLAAGVAHDFNNVLTAILGNVTLARQAAARGELEDVGELLEGAEQASQRGAELVRQLLNYAGKGRREVQPVDVCRVASDTIAIVRASVPRKVTLHLDLPRDCPPLQADVGQIQQLLLNLVLNGAEAIGERVGTVDVSIRLCDLSASELRERYPGFPLTERPYVEIGVRDTGEGMTPETLRQIFDPFFTTKFLGRGLGLAAALGVVRAHGGGIAVHSTPGEGSLFTVILPVERTTPASETLKTIAETVTDAARGQGLVLVVDDEPTIRTLIERALEELGYTVILADHGAQAVELVDRIGDELVLVVLDLVMPTMDGADAALALHGRRADLPILVMSGLADDDALRRLGQVPIAGFVPKPFSLEQLAQAVAVALKLRRR